MATAAQTPVDFSAAFNMAPTPLADWLIVMPVAWCLLAGAVLLMLRKRTALHPGIAIFALIGLCLFDAALLVRVLAEGPLTMVMGRWLPPFGIAFTVDLMGALFALTAALVALAAGVFGRADVDTTGRRYGFYPFLMLLMAGVSGAFLTGDVFNLYVWFEVLLIASFGLLVLGSERAQIDGATKYAFLNLVGTTLFLIATGYLYGLFGSLNMADIIVKAPQLRDTAPLMTLTTLYLLAFAMKAAAFPVNFWLPASYHTPKLAVSALFGGLLTKVGIYALIRVLVMLFPVERDHLAWVIAVIAALTMVLGVVGALAQNDTRRAVGYLVISGIGVMMAGIALGSPGGLSGTIFYALHSMVVMTALYFAAGIGGTLAGSFLLSRSGGLYAGHAVLAFTTLALFFSVAGLPPFSGLWPKVLLVKAALDVGAWWLAASILVTGFLTTIATGRIWLLAYWRPAPVGAEPGTNPRAPTAVEGRHEPPVAAPGDAAPPFAAMAVLLALTSLSVVFGLWPEPLLAAAQEAAAALLDPSAYVLSVFPGEVPQ
ncbi:Na+/H+ antiporter subunit D [Pseudohoeflea coraliihabitans]|uniref:Na+/H+ antiporter subunit D n=1 Tax=Pseudohoeflea coraliihabitans TaxID=2860393 RepID=A0ABS6WRS3_9HYPH|nr:Na+/H+ antiporter subunit D [Pseudohoeflea sp. DP4N28-3]MBW3098635.1 Na+/H+ antiporter subunit D [Pseudohoeflea sp. DP4N28-3]